MKYICSVCGYIYDESKQKTPFDQLPASWVCPLCGAAKSAFSPQGKKEEAVSSPVRPLEIDEDMQQLSAGELSALCSNLARGCEKQYKEEEAALFRQIADYFAAATPPVSDAGIDRLADLLQADLPQGYPAVSGSAQAAGDRGTQRVCVWGEKVTAILYSLLDRYRKEGPGFLRGTQIWVCSVCGFTYVGQTPPELCPVCKVPAWKFEKVEGRESA